MSSLNYCFLTCIQIAQEAGQVVWYSYLFQNFPQFGAIHIVKEMQVQSLGQEGPLEKDAAPTPAVLAGESHGQNSPAGYSPQGCRELDTTEATQHSPAQSPRVWVSSTAVTGREAGL